MNASMSACGIAVSRPSRSVNPTRLERRTLVEGPAVRLCGRRVVAAGAVAAPVHRAVVGHPAQALRRHRTLHRLEDGIHGLPRDQVEQGAGERPGVVEQRPVRVAEIPRQAVEIAEHVAGRAGRVAVARRDRGVVEEPAADHDARRLRVVHRHVRRLRPGRRVDDRDRVVEARQHIDLPSLFVEDEARGAASAHGDVARRARHERVVLELCRGEHPYFVGPEGRDIEGRPVAGHGHALRQGEGPGALGVRDRRAAAIEVDVLVQVPRGDAAPGREHGDPALVQVPAQAVPHEDPGALEPIGVVAWVLAT